jgi:hypothetical protein
MVNLRLYLDISVLVASANVPQSVLLLQHGWPPHAPWPPAPPPFSVAFQNTRGISPLGVAVGFNRQAVVGLLLDAGADLEAKDGQGNTALHYAAGERDMLVGGRWTSSWCEDQWCVHRENASN